MKENISPTSSNSIMNSSSIVSVTSKNNEIFSSIPLRSNICAANIISTRNLETVDERESHKTQFESESFKRSLKTPERCFTETSTSRGFSTTPPMVPHRDRDLSTPKKRLKSELINNEIDKSFLSLCDTISSKIQNSNLNSNTQTISNKSEKDAENKFLELISAELRNMSEKECKEKKRKIMDILWN